MASEEMLARREKWAEALESGKYAQTKGRLHDDNGYCCLGVACDLYAKEQNLRWARIGVDVYDFDGKIGLLPDSVASWLGVTSTSGDFQEDGSYESLAGKNDQDATFAEIAAIIRAAPEGLFDD